MTSSPEQIAKKTPVPSIVALLSNGCKLAFPLLTVDLQRARHNIYNATPSLAYYPILIKNFWEELIAYFPSIRHGQHRKRSRCLTTIEDTQTNTHTHRNMIS
jgi:hypothetical protein